MIGTRAMISLLAVLALNVGAFTSPMVMAVGAVALLIATGPSLVRDLVS